MRSRTNKPAITVMFSPIVSPVMAAAEPFIVISSKGSISGKLKIAMSAKLLLVRDAIADIIVSTAENPILLKNKNRANKFMFSIILPIRAINMTRLIIDKIIINRLLYRIFEIIIDCGFATV